MLRANGFGDASPNTALGKTFKYHLIKDSPQYAVTVCSARDCHELAQEGLSSTNDPLEHDSGAECPSTVARGSA